MGDNYRAIWNESLNQLNKKYTEEGRKDEFTLWFNLEYMSDEGNTITAGVATEFMGNQMIERGIIKAIKEKIKEISGTDVEIVFFVKKTSVRKEEGSKEEKAISKIEENSAQKGQKDGEKEIKQPEFLNKDFTFESFVPGENNMFAYTTAVNVSKDPGNIYNPLVLYGGSGLGKTHLMQAIGNSIYNNKKGKVKMLYINTESLLNEFTSSIKNKTTEKFKSKYRNLDVFLLDDIYFLEGKEAIQDEVFYTFEALSQKKSQMVFTCDRPINELKGLNERLKTRLLNGMNIDMQPPNYETRKAILLKKLSLMEKTLDDEIVDFIAANIENDVRSLEGTLKKVVGYSEFLDRKMTLEDAKPLVMENAGSNLGGNISIETIQKVVAEHFGISFSEIKSKKQNKKIAYPRHVAIYIARNLTENSFTEIGIEFGGKDHSTIMSSCKKIEDLIKTDPAVDSLIKMLIKEIKSKKQ